MSVAPIVKDLTAITPHDIGDKRTVNLAVLAVPADASGTTVAFEIWEPGGSQPDNSHEESTETFIVLQGTATAYSDEHTAQLAPGNVIVLPEGSVHHIVNTSPSERLYTITVMANDGGFSDLITTGPLAEFDAADLAVLKGVLV